MDDLAVTAGAVTDSNLPLDGALGELTLSEFMTLWRETDLIIPLKLVGANPYEPGFIGAVRGTWGQYLLDEEAKGCDRAHHLLNIVFRQRLPALPQGGMIARPIVFETDVLNTANLIIRVRFFGFGDSLVNAVAESLPAALARGVWIRGHRFRVQVQELSLSRVEGLEWEAALPPNDLLTVHFDSPYVTGAHHSSPNPVALLDSLTRRVCGLCRWHGFELITDPNWKKEIHDASIDASALTLQSWLRHTNRNETRRSIVMIGFSGRLVLSNPPDKLVQLIVFGARCHAGARTSFGLGRYHMAIV